MIKLELTAANVQLIIDALGNMPHNRVRELIDNIVDQANEQIDTNSQTQQA